MSVLEAFSTDTPVMLRDLELYQAIIDGYYIKTKDVNEMDAKLKALVNDQEQLAHYKQMSQQASQQYSEDNLAKTWLAYYTQQFKEYHND